MKGSDNVGTKEIIESNLNLVKSMAEDGRNERDIAESIGVSYASWKRYKAKNEDLKAQIKEIKNNRVQSVEDSLYKCANGYSYYEEVPTKVKEEVLTEDGKTILVKERIEVTKVKKYRGADINAIKYFLNNKAKRDWKESVDKAWVDRENIKLKEKELKTRTLEL